MPYPRIVDSGSNGGSHCNNISVALVLATTEEGGPTGAI